MSATLRKFGWLGPSPPDYRDYLYGPPTSIFAEISDQVDLRLERATPRVFDQQNLGSCVANAVNAVLQYVERKAGDPDYDRLSRLFTYYYSREKIGTVSEDSGSFIRDAFKVAAERGVPREAYWPYYLDNFAVEPQGAVVESSAPHHRLLEYRSIPRAELALQACLAEGYPFVFGFAVYESFWTIGRDGIWHGQRGRIDGYHAVACWGYDFRRGALGFESGGWIIRNSWGAEHGDEGYYYVPRSYMVSEATDIWTARKVSR